MKAVSRASKPWMVVVVGVGAVRLGEAGLRKHDLNKYTEHD